MKRITILLSLLFPGAAYANVVWPALYLETRLFTWWAISIGLIIESIFILWLFRLPVKKSVIAVVAANTVSAIAGILLIPLSGIAWELFPASIYKSMFEWGTFNPLTWAGTFGLACLINATIEGAIYRKWFVPKFRFRSINFIWIIFANAFSVGAALVSIWLKPLQL